MGKENKIFIDQFLLFINNYSLFSVQIMLMRIKKLLKPSLQWLIWVPGILIILFLFTGFQFLGQPVDPYFNHASIIETRSSSEKQLLSLNDSLPHYQYKELEDSLAQIESVKKMNNKLLIEGFSLGILGFYTEIKDSIYIDSITQESKIVERKKANHYLGLSNYYLNSNHYQIFRDSGKSYLKYPVWTKIDSAKKSRTGYYAVKALNVDVSELSQEKIYQFNTPRTLYIPVSKTKFNTLKIIIGGLQTLLAIFSFIVIFLMPIWVLKDIANNACFEERTYKRLFLISITILTNCFINTISPYLIRWFLADTIPDAFSLNLALSLKEMISSLIAGYIILILAFAFRKGHQLQQEQTLTI